MQQACALVDASCGAGQALRAVWTRRGQHPCCPPHAHDSCPSRPQGTQAQRGALRLPCRENARWRLCRRAWPTRPGSVSHKTGSSGSSGTGRQDRWRSLWGGSTAALARLTSRGQTPMRATVRVMRRSQPRSGRDDNCRAIATSARSARHRTVSARCADPVSTARSSEQSDTANTRRRRATDVPARDYDAKRV